MVNKIKTKTPNYLMMLLKIKKKNNKADNL